MQLLYADSTRCVEHDHLKRSPAIKFWTSIDLKKRQKIELRIGGFGRLEINEDEPLIDEDEKLTPEEITPQV